MTGASGCDWPDDVKRVRDGHNTALIADPDSNIGHFMAFSLQDGSTNGTIYDRFDQADRAGNVLMRFQVMILQVQPQMMSSAEAESVLRTFRRQSKIPNLVQSNPQTMERNR
jgi:hypothetical protein